MKFVLPKHIARYSRVFLCAYLFATLYAAVIFLFAVVHLLTSPPETSTEYAAIVSDRLLSGRIYVLPVLFGLFQLTFWKQRYFSEALIVCAAWIASTYIEDYFTLGARFLITDLWPAHLLLAIRPLMLVALLWMVIEQRLQR